MLRCQCCLHPLKSAIPKVIPHPPLPTCKIPMRSLDFMATIENSIVCLLVTQEFLNSESNPLEVQYSFYLPEDSVISSLKIHQDGSTLIPKIKDSEFASELYEQTILSGRTAVLGSVEEDNQQMTLSIGNLGPGDSIKVELGMSFPLQAD